MFEADPNSRELLLEPALEAVSAKAGFVLISSERNKVAGNKRRLTLLSIGPPL